jgi:hypothetical protein
VDENENKRASGLNYIIVQSLQAVLTYFEEQRTYNYWDSPVLIDQLITLRLGEEWVCRC